MVECAVAPLTDRAAFIADWTALYAEAQEPGFFQTPAWIAAWLEGAPPGAALHRIEARSDGATVLLGACAARRKPPLAGMREAWFQEYGEPARDAIYPEYVDFLTAKDAPPTSRLAALGALIDAQDCDSLVFRNVRPRMTRAALSAAAARGLSVRVLREQPVYVCELGGPSFLDSLKTSLQSKIRRSMRLYEARGPLTGRVAATEAERAAAWERLKTLHREGWKARNAAGVFDNPHLSAFHERLQAKAPDAFHLFEVKAGGDTIAVLYNFVHGKRVLNYQGGFDFENDNRLAPGFVAHAMAAQHYQNEGFEIYDLLAGDADYKARLGRIDRTLTSLVIERPTWRNRLRGLFRA